METANKLTTPLSGVTLLEALIDALEYAKEAELPVEVTLLVALSDRAGSATARLALLAVASDLNTNRGIERALEDARKGYELLIGGN